MLPLALLVFLVDLPVAGVPEFAFARVTRVQNIWPMLSPQIKAGAATRRLLIANNILFPHWVARLPWVPPGLGKAEASRAVRFIILRWNVIV